MADEKHRAVGHRWKPGESGNPKGRPRKGNALSEAIRWKCDPNELVDIALTIARTSKLESIRLQALQWLRDSGYTRPEQRHALDVSVTTPRLPEGWSSMPIAAREAYLAQLAARPLPVLDVGDDEATGDTAVDTETDPDT